VCRAQENTGASTRFTTAKDAGRVGLRATTGELWAEKSRASAAPALIGRTRPATAAPPAGAVQPINPKPAATANSAAAITDRREGDVIGGREGERAGAYAATYSLVLKID